MAAARLLLRLAGRLESANFLQSVCGLLGAEQVPGPWHAHCSLERGRLVLSSHWFPGASERLPIQVGTRGPAGKGRTARGCGRVATGQLPPRHP